MASDNKFKLIKIKNCILINLNYYNLINIHNIKINLENDNLYVHIPDNLNLTQPIYLVNEEEFYYNITILIGTNSKLSIIEHKQQQHNTTSIICKANIVLDYYLIQENDRSTLNIKQCTNSICNITLLSSNTNNNINAEVELLESNTQAKLNILQKTSFTYENHINLVIKHLNNQCYSNTLSRIIADDQAKCSFIGKIIVSSNGKNTNANLQSKGLILNKKASINNSPELIIDHNEVICSHGASIGNLDQEALFYLQTRGLSLENAKLMLINAFLQPISKSIQFKGILEILEIV